MGTSDFKGEMIDSNALSPSWLILLYAVAAKLLLKADFCSKKAEKNILINSLVDINIIVKRLCELYDNNKRNFSPWYPLDTMETCLRSFFNPYMENMFPQRIAETNIADCKKILQKFDTEVSSLRNQRGWGTSSEQYIIWNKNREFLRFIDVFDSNAKRATIFFDKKDADFVVNALKFYRGETVSVIRLDELEEQPDYRQLAPMLLTYWGSKEAQEFSKNTLKTRKDARSCVLSS